MTLKGIVIAGIVNEGRHINSSLREAARVVTRAAVINATDHTTHHAIVRGSFVRTISGNIISTAVDIATRKPLP